jgi:hypothetical protein
MNLLAATMGDPAAAIGVQPWYSSIVPLIQLSFPTGTDISPVLTCNEFLQLILSLPPDVRTRILNTEIPETAEQIEEVKRAGHKNLLVAICIVLLVFTILITGFYVSMTTDRGQPIDSNVMSQFFTFIIDILKMLIGDN